MNFDECSDSLLGLCLLFRVEFIFIYTAANLTACFGLTAEKTDNVGFHRCKNRKALRGRGAQPYLLPSSKGRLGSSEKVQSFLCEASEVDARAQVCREIPNPGRGLTSNAKLITTSDKKRKQELMGKCCYIYQESTALFGTSGTGNEGNSAGSHSTHASSVWA